MNCHYHEEASATAQCNKCGRALCQECANLYTSPLCGRCARQMSSELWQSVKRLGAIGATLAIAYTAMLCSSGGGQEHLLSTLVQALILGCVPFGWHFLNEHLPRTILVLPLLGWLIFFALKFVGSVFIGWACCPWAIHQAYDIQRTVDATEAMRTSLSAERDDTRL